jgi:hypothetical protein
MSKTDKLKASVGRNSVSVLRRMKASQRSPDGAELAERNPGSSPTPRIPASGLHPGYNYCEATLSTSAARESS